jgi:hypothetical protein
LVLKDLIRDCDHAVNVECLIPLFKSIGHFFFPTFSARPIYPLCNLARKQSTASWRPCRARFSRF